MWISLSLTLNFFFFFLTFEANMENACLNQNLFFCTFHPLVLVLFLGPIKTMVVYFLIAPQVFKGI